MQTLQEKIASKRSAAQAALAGGTFGKPVAEAGSGPREWDKGFSKDWDKGWDKDGGPGPGR